MSIRPCFIDSEFGFLHLKTRKWVNTANWFGNIIGNNIGAGFQNFGDQFAPTPKHVPHNLKLCSCCLLDNQRSTVKSHFFQHVSVLKLDTTDKLLNILNYSYINKSYSTFLVTNSCFRLWQLTGNQKLWRTTRNSKGQFLYFHNLDTDWCLISLIE